MFQSNQQTLSFQIKLLKKRFFQTDENPLNKILSSKRILDLVKLNVEGFRERFFSPITTIAIFLRQVLSEDQSCRNAVAAAVAESIARNEKVCSSRTGSYCKARKRLPEELLETLARETGSMLHQQADPSWLWKRFSAKLIDGSTISMPDTDENQKEYPQVKEQKKGLGFPIARIVVVTCLATGSVLDMAMAPYQGKETGEHALFRQIIDCFQAGDIALADRYYCSYFLIAELLRRGVHVIFQQHASRKSDFRRGKKLGKKDHLVIWTKPKQIPKWMDNTTWEEMPETLEVREFKVHGKVIVTTLKDPKKFSKKELGEQYVKRWLIEIDIKFIKQVMQMDILRCKTPSMVRKEIWVHLLAYNLLRTLIAQSALYNHLHPRGISFKGALQLWNSFQGLALQIELKYLSEVTERLLSEVGKHRIGNRPGRSEPRAVKRRPKPYPRLQKPRKSI